MSTPLYHWDGTYFGFVSNDNVFDRNCRYLGYLDLDDGEDGGEVWGKDGRYIGDLIDDHYVMRRTYSPMKPIRPIRPIPPTPPMAPVPPQRPARPLRPGWVDGFRAD